MPAQVGRLGAGAFDPAFDELVAADALLEQRHRLDAVVHPAAAQRVGDLQLGQLGLVGQPGVLLVDGRRLIVKERDLPAAVGRLAGRVGDGRHVVEVELLGRAESGPRPARGSRWRSRRTCADLVGGEHHGDRHQRQAVGLAAFDDPEDPLLTRHSHRSTPLDDFQPQRPYCNGNPLKEKRGPAGVLPDRDERPIPGKGGSSRNSLRGRRMCMSTVSAKADLKARKHEPEGRR